MQSKERLQRIIDDPATSASERRETQMELDALEPATKADKYPLAFCGPLGPDLLQFAGTHELQEVSWRDLVRLTESREWPGKWDNHDLQVLWLGWIVWGCPFFRDRVWSAIKEEFPTEQERRAEFERINRVYPHFDLIHDNPYELEMYERHLDCSDRNLILAITRKKLAETPEYDFRTREVAQRIIAKLQREQDARTDEQPAL